MTQLNTTTALTTAAPAPRTGARLALLLTLAGILGALGLFAAQQWLRPAPLTAADLDAQQQRVAVAESLQRQAEGATVPLVQLLVTPDREMRIPLYKQIDTANAAAEGDLAALALLVKAPQEKAREEQARVQELLELRARYDERYTAAVEKLELSGAQGALSQFWAPTREALSAMTQASRRLAEQERSALATQRMTLESHGAETQRLMWVVAAVALLAAALGGLGVRMLGRGAVA
jgi:methyl-accepting chemotaxis protein